ncbi:ATP-binding protein [Terrabacter sp. MAHUQ-38]|uniref:ATP-binding protein n=1 Tax=unclassified Terrabacter TaxID=2630222 RepID=UPI00165E92C3|nr:ATP-binding protein [Terrabacter sp. MAHUQ-38]
MWSLFKKREERRTPVGDRAQHQGRQDDWALRAVVNHVTFSGKGSDRMIAWYLADPQTWSFRSIEEGEGLIYDQAVQLAELVGTTIYCRVTTRPYPVHHWAAAAYANAPEPQPGFDEMMRRDQLHMAQHTQADKLVFYGVDLGERGVALKALGKVLSGAVDREMQALEERLQAVDSIMAGPGIEAGPASPKDMEWLLARSYALGCPVPVPGPDETDRYSLDEDDLAEFVNTASWTAEPLGSSVRIATTVNDQPVTRHVVVLTVARVGEIQIPEKHEPWMAKSDRLGFPVEWFYRVDPRAPEEISREMTRLTNRIDGQMTHWRDEHGKRPPKQLARQADRAADVEDEMRTEFTGLSTRTRGWYRVAVSGATEKEALERASRLVNLYKPQIKLVRELGQYHLAREFVPGEPLSSNAHARKFPILKVAAGLPAITAEVGDRRGAHIGETAGLSSRAVCFDPWFLTEVMEQGGLVPVVGTPGSGKSMFLGTCSYKFVLSGVRGVAMDPAGRLQKMLRLPELAPISRSVDLLGGAPGSLSPYAVVPDPNRALVELESEDEQDFATKLELAENAARSTRRDLAYETLRWCLPLSMGRDAAVQSKLRAAITASPDTRYSSAMSVVEQLQRGDSMSQDVANELVAAAQRELGRLFFHARTRTPTHLERAEEARFTVFNLKGLVKPDQSVDLEDYTPEELLYRPIMALAAWSSLQLIYRGDPHERKLFVLDEAQEVTEGSGAGRTLVYKLSSDSRKNNCAALVAMQNASTVLGANNVNNFVGAALVGRTQDIQAQRDALKLLGKHEGIGYEEILGNLSPRGRRSEERLGFREFIYRDGLGGEGGRGGMEKIRVSLAHHPELFEALNTTASPEKRASRLAQLPARDEEGAA